MSIKNSKIKNIAFSIFYVILFLWEAMGSARLCIVNAVAYLVFKFILFLQGGVQVPTGGTAHEPKEQQAVDGCFESMIRLDSEADSIVWIKEGKWIS